MFKKKYLEAGFLCTTVVLEIQSTKNSSYLCSWWSPGLEFVKCVTGSSAAYLCDRITNESCLYLCTSSNRRRWAAFITELWEACCHMKFEPRPRRALGITKGKIHSRANLGWNDGSRQCQSPLLIHGGCDDDGTRSLCVWGEVFALDGHWAPHCGT